MNSQVDFAAAFVDYQKHLQITENTLMIAAIAKAIKKLPTEEEQVKILKTKMSVESLVAYLRHKKIDPSDILTEFEKMSQKKNDAPTESVLQGPLVKLPLRPAPKPAGENPLSPVVENGQNSSAVVQGPVVINRPSRPRIIPAPAATSEPSAPEDAGDKPAGFKNALAGGLGKAGTWLKKPFGNKNQTGDSADKPKKNSNMVKWVFGMLALIILLISVGVVWRLGNENGEYNSSESSSASDLSLPVCTTTDGLAGVTRYNITPNPDIVGLSGFIDPQRTQLYQNPAFVFEQGKSYQAIIVGDNYRVGLSPDISVYAPVFSFTQTGSECVQELAVEVLTRGIESQQNATVQLAYKIDFSHWSGLLVTLSLLGILGFTGITLFMSGGKFKEMFSMLIHVISIAAVTSVADMPPWAFFVLYFLIGYHASVNFGNKSELQEQKDSFEAGNQLKLPESMKSLFESLSRGLGLVGGYDWSQSAIYSALMMFVGAVYPSASPLVRAFDSQMIAIVLGGLFVLFSFAMEAWRRGLVGDWVAFGLGFIGLLDFGIYFSAFGSNPPSILDLPPTGLAILGWAATFIVALLLNLWSQAASERTELQRDRLSDGMLFCSAMKLVAVLMYVFMFLM